MLQLTASVVLYKNDEAVYDTIGSFLNSHLSSKLYLIDNSPDDSLKNKISSRFKSEAIEYIFNVKNIGYGKAHNIALKNAVDKSTYHLVLNPDVSFDKGTLEEIYHFMEDNKQAGQLLPKVLYDDDSLQKLCKLLPTPLNLFGRRFSKNSTWAQKLNDAYELKGFNYDRIINLPNLSGCFMFLRTENIKKIGGFDPRYFMYMEDIDLTRRMHRISETLFYPHVTINHGFKKQSYTSNALLKHHVNSAIKYFNKWGWMHDKERDKFNRNVITTLNNTTQQKNPVSENAW